MSVDVSAAGVRNRVTDLITRGQQMFADSFPCVGDPIPDRFVV